MAQPARWSSSNLTGFYCSTYFRLTIGVVLELAEMTALLVYIEELQAL